MKRTTRIVTMCLSAGIAASLALGIAAAQQDKSKPAQPASTPAAKPGDKPAAKPAAAPHEMGMSPEDQKAMEEAAKPGPMHAMLNKSVGTWKAQCSMWMAPDAEPITSESTMTCASIMGGLFTQCQMSGEVPGMGTMSGMGIYGYDNVAKKFQATWVMSCGSGMMTGTGELQSDGSTINWTYNHTCPVRKKACTMREVEKITGPDTKTITTYMEDPASGKEYKAMEMTLTRQKK